MADLTTGRANPGIFTIVVSGEWDFADDDAAEEACSAAIISGAAGVLVDLEACSFMDSSALRRLYVLGEELRRRSTAWSVLAAGSPVRRLFEVTGADQALPLAHGAPGGAGACRRVFRQRGRE